MNSDNNHPNETGMVERGTVKNDGLNIAQPRKPSGENGNDKTPPHDRRQQKPTGFKAMKTSIMAAIVVIIIACIAAAYFTNNSSEEDQTGEIADSTQLMIETGDSIEVISKPENSEEETPSVKETQPEETPAVKTHDEAPAPKVEIPAQKPAYNTPYGRYDGPKSGGVPHGFGTVKVTSTATVSDFNSGADVTIRPGDEIRRAKFVDGKFVQGELWRNGSKIALIGSGAI